MPCLSIPKFKLNECENRKCPFIFYDANDLDNGQFNKLHESKNMNN